jgi:hypothetical protein
VVGAAGRPGHFGLPGMQERAKLAGGKLALLSGRDSGTEVDLTVPAALAYAESPLEPGRDLWERELDLDNTANELLSSPLFCGLHLRGSSDSVGEGMLRAANHGAGPHSSAER